MLTDSLESMHRPLLRLSCLLCAAMAATAWAQDGAPTRERVYEQPENVRIEFAQVLRAEPVFQTLRATSMVERCDAATPVEPPPQEERRGLSRVVGAVRDVLKPGREDEPDTAPAPREGCRMVPVEREFRRPIAYDVDYVHRGVRYRSRLPYDPGNRLRVRVSVMPVAPPEDR